MTSNLKTRQLSLADAQAVQACYDSQPKLMLIEKGENDPPYADIFNHLLRSGCIAFGVYDSQELKAFSVFWPWPHMPAATLVLAVNRPDGALYNPQRSGLQAALDAGLAHLESEGRSSVYFVRSAAKRWKHSVIRNRLGRLGEYHSVAIEKIPAGALSRFNDFNRLILGGRPVRGDAILVHSVVPQNGDF